MLIPTTSFRDLAEFTGKDYQRLVRIGLAWFGRPGPKLGRSARELTIDDGYGIVLSDLFLQYGFKTELAVNHATRIFHELGSRALLPGQIWNQEDEVPRIVVRIHKTKESKFVYEIRTYDHFPKVLTNQNEERVDVGAYTARRSPETALGTTPSGPVYEVEATGLALHFANYFREKFLKMLKAKI